MREFEKIQGRNKERGERERIGENKILNSQKRKKNNKECERKELLKRKRKPGEIGNDGDSERNFF